MDDLTLPIDPATVETLGEDLAWQSLVKSAEMAPTATVVRAMRDYAEHRCADAVKAAEAKGAAAALRDAAEIGTPGPAVMCRSPKDRDDQWRKALQDRAALAATQETST